MSKLLPFLRLLTGVLFLLQAGVLPAQKDFYKHHSFTTADTLRGMLRPERSCYDVTYYDLNIRLDIDNRTLSGFNDIHFLAIEDFETLQLDLFENMEIHKVVFAGKELPYERRYDAVFIRFPPQKKGTRAVFRVYYKGEPLRAKNPPWAGGFIWKKDRKGKPWVSVSCQGDGASLWWPNKDHLSDEPDSMAIRVAVPADLMCVANGNLRRMEEFDGMIRYHWFVSYPINNYNVTLNVADYVHFSDTYCSPEGDSLTLDYYVLSYNEDRARVHFRQVKEILGCYERYFGKYPFWEDGFALVETPYLGMEHQSAIAYGNHYQRGYLGSMIPEDMDWDFIIVHETGHEYFGNSISVGDLSEMWIHESFTTYMEALYVECSSGYEDAVRYLNHFRNPLYILNREPILGPAGVNWDDWAGSDHYFKGSWVLHTLRHTIHNDSLWFDLLRTFYDKYQLSIVRTDDFIRHVNMTTGKDFAPFFEQYLEYPSIPALEYSLRQDENGLHLRYRWKADVAAFDMPVLVGMKGAYRQIHPTTTWAETFLPGLDAERFSVATELFLIRVKRS